MIQLQRVYIIVFPFTFISPAVPTPTTALTSTKRPYTGTIFTLTCIIQLHENVDTNVDVVVAWRKRATLLTNNSYTSISQTTTTVGGSTYTTSVILTPLRNEDDGGYVCHATVTPNPTSTYILKSRSNISVFQVKVLGRPQL